jgi:hypothetical protein
MQEFHNRLGTKRWQFRISPIITYCMKASTKSFCRSFQHTSVIVVAAFSTRPLKTSIGLEEHSRMLHQHLCIHYSKINAPFSQNFSLNHRINA